MIIILIFLFRSISSLEVLFSTFNDDGIVLSKTINGILEDLVNTLGYNALRTLLLIANEVS